MKMTSHFVHHKLAHGDGDERQHQPAGLKSKAGKEPAKIRRPLGVTTHGRSGLQVGNHCYYAMTYLNLTQ